MKNKLTSIYFLASKKLTYEIRYLRYLLRSNFFTKDIFIILCAF